MDYTTEHTTEHTTTTTYFGRHLYAEGEGGRYVYELITSPETIRLIPNWRFNRPCDILRVHEIQKYISETGICDGELLLAILPDGEGCVCYDGNHRLQACKLTFPKYGVRVRIITDATEQEVKQEFQRINRSIPVPTLYFSAEQFDRVLLKIVSDFVNQITTDTNIKEHMSTSKRPCKPNFNRDVFVDELTVLLKDTFTPDTFVGDTSTDSTVDETVIQLLRSWFNRMNDYIRDNIAPRTYLSNRVADKCARTGCYFFIGDWKRYIQSVPLGGLAP